MKRQKPIGVFFDWDGTLADTYAFLEACHNATRQALGYEIMPVGLYTNYFGQEREKVFAGLYPGREDEAKIFFTDFVNQYRATLLKPMEGARQLLEQLQKMNIPAGIVTNKKQELVELEISHLGWGPFFRSIVGAGQAARDKPHPDPLYLALERGGMADAASPGLWFVGDTDFDVACARTANCTPVYVLHGRESPYVSPNDDDITIVPHLLALRNLLE
ncbi:MAG: HAD family hydrolase [Alphaproteobacteria bacterium]|nr:HAD family hydrolase [Alphaproteobacteria bacterium]